MNQLCPINRCGRPLGIGTHMTITGDGRAADRTVQVCEDHWQAVRQILPVPVEPATSGRYGSTEEDGRG